MYRPRGLPAGSKHKLPVRVQPGSITNIECRPESAESGERERERGGGEIVREIAGGESEEAKTSPSRRNIRLAVAAARNVVFIAIHQCNGKNRNSFAPAADKHRPNTTRFLTRASDPYATSYREKRSAILSCIVPDSAFCWTGQQLIAKYFNRHKKFRYPRLSQNFT